MLFRSDIILLDTIGELSRLYSIGEIIFVGKSLFLPGGGHSLIEPVSFGKVVFHGPYIEYNFDTATILRERGIAIEVKDSNDLVSKVISLLQDKERILSLSVMAKEFIKERKGTSKKLAGIIADMLDERYVL